MSAGGRAILRALELLALPLALLALWWLLSASSTSPFFPPLSDIVGAADRVWTTATLSDDVLPSLLRLLTGFSLATVAGVALGTAIGLSRRAGYAAAPVLEFLRAIPPPVLVPAMIALLGIGETMRASLIAFGCVWPVLLNTVDGVRSIDGVARDAARSMRLSPAQQLVDLILPASAPRIMTGMYQALGIAVVLMVISEMFAASTGVGAMVVRFQQSFSVTEMWNGVLMLSVIGVALAAGFRVVERRVLHWHLATRAGAGA